jgi:phosphonate transport system substrate-binding protein
MAAVGPIADDLAAALGRPVELLPLFSYGAMIDALTERRIDGGFFSTAAFALADARCDCLEPLVAPRAADGTLAYHAVIVVRSDSGIATLADLGGKTVAVGAADSIGSRRTQLAGLLSEGFDPAQILGAVLEVDAADKAVRLVAAGAADAAFGWSSLAGDVAGGYTRGTLTDTVASGAVAMDRLAILWRSPAIGHAPFALLRSLPEADKDRIEAYLVGLAATNPAAYDALNPYYGGGYAPADPQNYGGFEALMAQNVDAVDLPLAPAETGATVAPPAPGPAPVMSSPSP